MKKFAFIGFFFLGLVFSVQSAIEVYEFDTPEQELLFKQLGKELRCPKCQNNNIADSNAGLAQDIRIKVYEMLKAGKTEDEIVDYMVARYGNFVTYDPPLTASTLVLWLGPILFLLLGFGFLFKQSRQKNQPEIALDDNEKDRLAQLLNDKDTNK